MSEANEITAGLLEKIPQRFFNIRVWRSNRIKAMALGRGGRLRMINAGVDGQGDVSGIIGPSGRRLEIEVKAGDDKLNEDQINFRDMILGLGGVYVEARSVESGLALLADNLRVDERETAGRLQSVAEIVNKAGGVDAFFEKARKPQKTARREAIPVQEVSR